MKISKAEILFMVALVLILTIICVAIVTTGGSAASLKGDTPTDVPKETAPPPTDQPTQPVEDNTPPPTHALHPSPYPETPWITLGPPPESPPSPTPEKTRQPDDDKDDNHGTNGSGLPTELPKTGDGRGNEDTVRGWGGVGLFLIFLMAVSRILRWGGRRGS